MPNMSWEPSINGCTDTQVVGTWQPLPMCSFWELPDIDTNGVEFQECESP